MKDRGPITTHVLDTSIGRPAAGVAISLAHKSDDETWNFVATAETDSDGRAGGFISAGTLRQGIYRLTFAIGDYFRGRGVATFYPAASVEFEVAATNEHYHVPLLVNPFGYSTYRGS